MSAKLLQALTDENPDLKKQIGCMAGIFQLFDRHHILSGKRINSHAHKRLPPGHSHLNESRLGVESIPSSPQRVMEKNWSKNVNENQRNSVESSRASFSSSSCSSTFSSLDCSKTAQSDPSSLERTTLLEKSPRSPSKTKNTGINSRPNHALCQDQPNTYSPSGRESIDLRDIVKDSIYREPRTLSVKTMTREDPMNHVLKHRDSPRPLQLSKSVDGSYAVKVNGKPDLHKSPRVLGKLKEAPWNLSEVRKLPGSSCETKDSSSFSVSKDTPRLSYDGQERPRRSFDYKNAGSKSTMKPKEPPRLSLDSRAGSMRSCNFDSKPGKSSPILALNPEQELGCNKQPPSVVAKLMGLEVMPNSSPAAHRQMGWMKASPEESHDIFNDERNNRLFSRRAEETEEGTQDRSSWSPKTTNSFKDPVSPRRRNPDSAMKPISSSRFPIEAAPWRQSGHGRRQKTALSNRHARERPQTSLSIYSEIKKRLEELEFPQSGKDIRDLKQMLDAIQVNGQLEKKTEEDGASCSEKCNNLNPVRLDQNPRLANKHNMRSSPLVSSPINASSNTASSFDSPIVIMKPAKFIDKSRFPASSVIPLDELSSVHKLRTGDSVDSRRVSVSTRTLKDPTPKLRLKVASNFVSKDKETNGKTVDNTSQKPRTRLTLILSRPQPLTLERTGGSSAKSLGSSSPRLQQKKVEPEKQSHSPIPSVDLSKPRRKPLRQQPELGSPGGRHWPKPAYSQQNDDQLSDISSETRILSHHDDEISVQSDSNIGLASQVDAEVTSANHSADVNIQPRNQSPSQRASNTMVSSLTQKKSLPSFGEDDLSVELTTVGPEQPSPVSVLDASFCKDDLLPSPVKKMENTLIDDTQNSDVIYGDEGWNRMDSDSLSASRHTEFSSQINHKKWEKIECLVQKLRRLNSGHDEISKDHIASLCENTNPDHRYISEVLLASGLLLKDFSSGTPQIQLHSSGQLINPDLFLVLEQTKISWLSKTEPACESILRSKANKDKLKRKLMFDVVNEILIQKLALNDPQREPWILPSKIAGAIPSGQRLLKELCSEIDLLKPDKLECNLDDNSIIREDVMHQAKSWKDFHKEVSGLVLDIERLIFKDLVDEIVSGELLRLRAKQNRRRRQLFAK